MTKTDRKISLLSLVLVALWASVGWAQNNAKPAPTHKNVSYGPHQRNALDLWQAKSDKPTPLVIYIHGGGFRNGSKNGVNAGTLKQLLEAGISVAALNYRYVTQVPLPAAHHDCRRAIQFLRLNREKWNLDPDRFGAFGGSAGAQLCMYLAFHDEMAKPDSADPLLRQSTRLACVATNGGQTTMDIDWWTAHIPGYEKPHRDFLATFGASDKAEYLRHVADVSALSLIDKNDPPIFMSYGMPPDAAVPDGNKANGWKVHHVIFGIELKKMMDALGIEADLKYPGAKTTYRSNVQFFKAKLIK